MEVVGLEYHQRGRNIVRETRGQKLQEWAVGMHTHMRAMLGLHTHIPHGKLLGCREKKKKLVR